MRFVATVAAAFLLASPVSGHHSDAALDVDTVVFVEGMVTEFSWRNPHIYFTMEATEDSGSAVEWTVQMASTVSVSRMGWTRDSLSVGDRVTERGAAAQAAYGETSGENPELSCIGRPTPALIYYSDLFPLEIEFVEAAQVIIIRGQFFDEERAIYMDGRGHPRLPYTPQVDMSPFNCDLESTRRFLPQ